MVQLSDVRHPWCTAHVTQVQVRTCIANVTLRIFGLQRSSELGLVCLLSALHADGHWYNLMDDEHGTMAATHLFH